MYRILLYEIILILSANRCILIKGAPTTMATSQESTHQGTMPIFRQNTTEAATPTHATATHATKLATQPRTANTQTSTNPTTSEKATSAIQATKATTQETSPTSQRTTPETQEKLPATSATSPKTQETKWTTQGKTPTTQATTPTTQATTPTTHATTPTTHATTPTTQATTPTTQATTPTTQATTPTTQATTPTTQATTPTTQATTPTTQATTPTTQATTPTTQATTSTTQATTPTTQATTPTTHATTEEARLQGYLLCPNQNVDLVCPSGKILKIQHADYGRMHQYLCGLGKTLNCTTKASTTEKLIEMCEGRRVCYLDTKEGRFIDACPEEIKYLHVVYKCVKGEEDTNRVAMAPEAPPPILQSRCGVSKSTRVTARVVEGTRSSPGKWPWQVLMLKGKYKRFTCGGTLIHSRWVLTAAHCIKSRKKHYYTIRVGEYDRVLDETHEQDILVKRAIRHPLYFTPYALNNDIALLELEKPVRFNDRVGIACLPELNYELPVNDPDIRCYITGWGKTNYKGYMSQMLRQVEIPPVDRRKCAVRLAKSPDGSNRRITKHMICGGDDNTGVSACQGDSGGPYVCRNKQGYWEVQGVISWGSPICSVKQRFTVFAQVSKFRRWIDKYLRLTPPDVTVQISEYT